MNARFYRKTPVQTIAAALLVAACGYQSRHLLSANDAAPAAAVLPKPPEAANRIFDGRDLVGNPKNSDGSDPQELKTLLTTEFAQTYASIVPSRSLILNGCAGLTWCDDAAYSFATSFQKIATAIKYKPPLGGTVGDADSLVQAWHDSALIDEPHTLPGALFPWTGKRSEAPFQLLAVVNRLDLANEQGGMQSGAEVRFVYGRTPVGESIPNFTIILEFVLPPMNKEQFLALAKSWLKISDIAADLPETLTASGYASSSHIRLRMNRFLAGDWRFSQWDFVPGITEVSPQSLTEQVNHVYATAAPGTEPFKTYLKFWQPKVLDDKMAIVPADAPPDRWEPGSIDYNRLRTLGTPGDCDTGTKARHVLALQQCTYCHTTESGTAFVHIGNRASGENAPLSAFLAGDGTKMPTLTDLYYANTDATPPTTVRYKTFERNSGQCVQVAPLKPEVHHYHDLGRRAIFLAGAATADKVNDPGWYSKVGTRMQH